MAPSLRWSDPKIKCYFEKHDVPGLFESLLTALLVMCPPDPERFVSDCLQHLLLTHTTHVSPDYFIAEDIKRSATKKQVAIADDEDVPTPEMFVLAYTFLNKLYLSRTFRAWRTYTVTQKAWKKACCKVAILHASKRRRATVARYFLRWIKWVKFRQRRRKVAVGILVDVGRTLTLGKVLQKWHAVASCHRLAQTELERVEAEEVLAMEEALRHAEEKTGGGSQDPGKVDSPQTDRVSALPTTVALRILGELSAYDRCRCSLVCRAWKVLTSSGLLWFRLDLSGMPARALSDSQLGCILHLSCRHLVQLNLRGCTRVTAQGGLGWVTLCRGLQDLNLSECPQLDSEALRLIVERCRELLYLNVACTSIGDRGLAAVSRNAANLQYLNVSYCDGVSDRGLTYLTEGSCLRRLIHLDLSGCVKVTAKGLATIARSSKCLESVVLNDHARLGDQALLAFTRSCHLVGSLSLQRTPGVTESSLCTLGAMPRLTELKVEGNAHLNDFCVRQTCLRCPRLRRASLVDCPLLTDAALRSLAQLRHLVVVNVGDCVGITDAGVRSLVEGPCGPWLTELNLANCYRISDMAVRAIAKRCKSLAYLNVAFCSRLTEMSLEMLAQTPCRLYSLDLTGCEVCCGEGLLTLCKRQRLGDLSAGESRNLTDKCMQKLCQVPNLRQLVRLDISHCELLTDKGIKSLTVCCRLLQVFNMADCKLVTDRGVQYVSALCCHLAVLDISGCDNLTDKSLHHVMRGLKKLRILVALRCPRIGGATAALLRAKLQSVEHSTDVAADYSGP